jgi:hypothetical protein
MPITKQQDINKAVDQAIKTFTERVTSGKLNLSVADFVRLMEFKQQQKKKAPKKISVTWVDNEWTKLKPLQKTEE